MSANILMRRQALGPCRVSSSRPSSGYMPMSRPAKPFLPARLVRARAAAPESDEDGVNEDLLEGEDFVEGESLDYLVAEDDSENVELDDESLAAIDAAQGFVSTYNDELILEVDLGGDELSSANAISAKAAAALDGLLAAGSSDAVLAVAGDDVAEAEGVEDKQGPRGFRKYDEDEQSGLSEEQRAQIASYKLTKTELSNLVPEDWDTINVDWFTNRKEDNIPLPEYKLNFIWTERNIAVAVDQVYSRGQISPLTEYFFWPRKDAWEELRLALEARPWISERDKVILLNRTTEVINYWQQDGEKPTLEQVRAAIPDCSFMGNSSPAPPPPAPSSFESPLALSA